ncbi:CU044_5270 family protein [Actinomadura violacea]|uniref:CU044_5270 family protein n=1 Tax=Actinomadura violacea TaxID=2819934 RepID=A0ABS3RXB5_9ACTN|nr:CU044_5270 family protein [Actinomadura violacea]MBO2461398.1 CU044_5270 family protein [Actinomadura violacea]
MTMVEDDLREALRSKAAVFGTDPEAMGRVERRIRRNRNRRAATAAGAAFAVAAAAVAVGVTGQHDDGPAARELLLTAADAAASAPAGTGRYWHTSGLSEELIQVGSPGRGTYQVRERARTDLWMPQDAAAPAWIRTSGLGAAPATKADEAVWRAQGSPATYRTTENGDVKIPAKPDKPLTERIKPGGYGERFGQELTPEDVRTLPADPARLRTALLRLIKRASADEGDEQLFDWGGSLLLRYPASPQVRAATYRMLAGLPGIRKLGTVTDRAGRTGTAVGLNAGVDAQGSRFTERLVLDPKTGRALAWESVMTGKGGKAAGTARAGQVETAQLTLESGWTGEGPPGR